MIDPGVLSQADLFIQKRTRIKQVPKMNEVLQPQRTVSELKELRALTGMPTVLSGLRLLLFGRSRVRGFETN